MAHSLTVNNTLELLAGGVHSTLAQCPGAVFRLAPNWDLSAPDPQNDLLQQLAVDGEQPTGRRAGNRHITLQVVILAPNMFVLAGAKEALLAAVNDLRWPLKWTRDPADNPGGLPMPVVFNCKRADQSVPVYSLVKENNRQADITISFQAEPYAVSDTQQTLTFPTSAIGSTPPPADVPLDNYGSVSGINFSQSTKFVVGPHSARWTSPGSGTPSYTGSFTAVDITGRGALSLWIGLGATDYYSWHAGNVVFNLTLKDTGGHSLPIGLTQYCQASADRNNPYFQQITAAIPFQSGFDYTHVNGYTFTCYSYSSWFLGGLMQADTYLDALAAKATTTGTPATARASIVSLFGIGSARAPLNLQLQMPAVSVAQSTTYTAAGAIAPFVPDAGVTAGVVEKWAGGAPGSRATSTGQRGGGKAGEYAKNAAYPFTPGTPVPGSVGAGGVPGAVPTNGGDTWFGVNDSTAAHGGVAPADNSATGSTTMTGTSTEATHFAGGSGANGAATGGGGGEAGGPSGAGNPGGNPAGGTGNANAGDGGAGGAAGANNPGASGVAPGGAGGGANETSAGTVAAGNGAAGQIKVSWTQVLSAFSAAIVHIPGPDAPQNLSPFTSVGNGADTPNGATEYAVPSLVSGTLADFAGTYSIVAVAFSFNGSTARTLTIRVRQYEYAGGPSVFVDVPARTFLPADITNGIIDVGEVTLPIVDLAPDNTTAFYTIAVTDTNTADRFLDVLTLDTAGSTMKWNSSTTVKKNLWLDEPDQGRPYCRVVASAFDRPSATSVIADCDISGGPPVIRPGSQIMMLYSPTGGPAAVASYKPRWYLDRYA
jgi:hypothetical protein